MPMKRTKGAIPKAASAVAALLMLAATPAFGNGSSCNFSAAGNAGLSFGLLNPATGGTVTANATLQVGDCNGAQTMLVTVSSTSQTMTGPAGATIAYTITNGSFAPGTAAGPGNNAYKTVTFTGTILQSAYADAVAGSYAGSVTVSVSP
jgi:hypothetical protein